MDHSGGERSDDWRVLGHHEWTAETEIEASLIDALSGLDLEEADVLYEYVDIDAVRDLLDGQANVEVRFEYEGYEVRITSEGHIAVR